MITSTIQIATLVNRMEQTATELIETLQDVPDSHFNLKPSAKNWSIAQVASHIYLSNRSIIKALALNGILVDRDPSERIEELKSVFLDYTRKFKSPDFITPDRDIYDRKQLMNDLMHSLQQIHRHLYKAEMSELINHPAFGNISKLEILYFVLFHTQRHTRQIKQIHAQITNEKS